MKPKEETTSGPRAVARDLHPERALLVFLLLLFGQLFLALWPTWDDGTYYDYGMLVPIVAPILFLWRWREIDRPPDQIAAALKALGRAPSTWILLVAGFLLVTFLRLIESVDSGWRAPLYLHWFTVWLVAAWLLSRLIGFSHLGRFLPVVVVTLLAVPLPSAVESSLIHGLTEGVAELSVTANLYMGFPVVRSGETLFAAGLPLQVSEGCSGIRSFQSSIFAGFLIGEFLRLGWIARIFLVASGVAIAFLANSGRVIFLVRHAFLDGQASLDKLHDVSGYVSLGATLVTIVLLGLLLERFAPPSRPND